MAVQCSKPFSQFTLLCSLLLILKGVTVTTLQLEEEKTLNLHDSQWKPNNNLPAGCFPRKSISAGGASTLEIRHRDYCSGKTIDWNRRLKQRLIHDEIQVKHLQSQIKRSMPGQTNALSTDSQIPLASGLRLQILNYIVPIDLGNRNMTVILDTGSDLTWVQCLPCRSCYNQEEPLFNPSLSPSYQSVSCNSTACGSLEEATGNLGVCSINNNGVASACNYYVSYGDGSYTRGQLAVERLSFGATDSVLDRFVFGCGRSNRGLFGGVSGLMGLGRSNLSLISQTSSIFQGFFSYCLPSVDSGSLDLGADTSVYRNTTPIAYTKMVWTPSLYSYYLLNLTGIRIGGSQLQAPSFGRNAVLIDSGTVITRLPPSIYSTLKAEFLRQFSGFPLAPGYSILDTCFDLSAYKEVSIPTIRLQFEGTAEVNVDDSGVFYFVKTDASQTCLALASLAYEDDIPILGNYQQKNLRVVYDTKQSMMGFAEERCGFE